MSDDLARRAKKHGLRYVEADSLPIRRCRSGRGFFYTNAKARRIRNPGTLERIRALVIPPAWEDVCIADDAKAHIQAIGRDSEGRLQYRYHDDWTAIRDKVKADRLLRFGQVLPKIRARLDRDMGRRRTDRRYAASVAARLIDRALIRAGHPVAATNEGGRGAATLLRNDVQLNGTRVSLKFTGKGGKVIEKTIRDPVLLARLRKLKQLGKKRLFCFRDDNGKRCYLSARDLNLYLRDAAGKPVTAKDFRTFAASAHALAALIEAERPESESGCRRLVASIMRETSEKLANTPAVTRSSYVHPLIVEAFDAGELAPGILNGAARNGLSQAETALMRFLEEAIGDAAPRPPANGNAPRQRDVSEQGAPGKRKQRKWTTASRPSGPSSSASAPA